MQNTAARKLKQVPEGYLIVGIDPHKKKHAAVAITQDLTIRDRFKLDNTREGLEFMVRRVRTEMVKSDCRGVMLLPQNRLAPECPGNGSNYIVMQQTTV